MIGKWNFKTLKITAKHIFTCIFVLTILQNVQLRLGAWKSSEVGNESHIDEMIIPGTLHQGPSYRILVLKRFSCTFCEIISTKICSLYSILSVIVTQQTWSGFSPTTVPDNNRQSGFSPTTVPKLSTGYGFSVRIDLIFGVDVTRIAHRWHLLPTFTVITLLHMYNYFIFPILEWLLFLYTWLVSVCWSQVSRQFQYIV